MTILRFITLWMTFSIVPVELKGFQDTNKSVEGNKINKNVLLDYMEILE